MSLKRKGRKMNILKKFLLIFLVANLLFLGFGLTKYEVKADFLSDIEGSAGDATGKGAKGAAGFINIGKQKATEGGLSGVTTSITSNFTGIGQMLTMIGAGVMVAVVTFMGIKYLTSAPDKQAALKQQLIGVVVAGIVIFGAYGIWSSLVRLLSNI